MVFSIFVIICYTPPLTFRWRPLKKGLKSGGMWKKRGGGGVGGGV